MSAKPTPGPYKICYVVDDKGMTIGCSIVTDDDRRTVVASFWRHDSLRTAMANARAWVEGMEAMDRLERIREIMDGVDWGESKLANVHAILDEDKP